MCSPDEAEITQILNDLHGETSDTAIARLLPLVYEQLRSLSDAYLAGERPDHTHMLLCL